MAKFKKLALVSSTVLTAAMLVSFGVACGDTHTHEFELKHDATNHWYACKDANCDVKVGETEHIWDEGEETLAPEVGVAGERTYTCLVCGETDTEPVDPIPANPLVVAEGSAVGVNYSGVSVTLNLEAGDYIAITDNDEILPVSFSMTEAGEYEVYFDVFDWDYEANAEVPFNYTVKKVPSVTLDGENMFGEAEIVTYAYVKATVTMPMAGKYKVTSTNAKFAPYVGESAESLYTFTTTEDNETVEFYVLADDTTEETTVVDYEISELSAEVISLGNVTLDLLPSTLTEVKLAVEEAGKYAINCFDAFAVFWKNADYDVLDQVNGFTFVEVTEDDYDETFEMYYKSFYVSSSFYNNTSFNVSALTDEMLANSSISWTFGSGETIATTTATLAEGTNLVNFAGMGLYMLSWTDSSISLSINGMEATTQSVVFGANPRAPMALTFISYAGEVEDTFTLTKLDGMNNVVDGSVEIYLAGMGLEIPAQLEAGDYEMSISSSTGLAVWGLDFSTGESTAEISTTPVTVTATGEIETLYVQGGMMPEFITLTIASPSGEGDSESVAGDGSSGNPYVVDANGGEYTDLAMQFNPRQNAYFAYFSFTATANGTITISNASPNEVMDDNGMVDAADVDTTNWTYTFNVVEGMTYTFNLGAMGLGATTISPTFTVAYNA